MHADRHKFMTLIQQHPSSISIFLPLNHDFFLYNPNQFIYTKCIRSSIVDLLIKSNCDDPLGYRILDLTTTYQSPHKKL